MKNEGWVTDSRFEIRDFGFSPPLLYRLTKSHLKSRIAKLESFLQPSSITLHPSSFSVRNVINQNHNYPIPILNFIFSQRGEPK